MKSLICMLNNITFCLLNELEKYFNLHLINKQKKYEVNNYF